jgi:hypothetical protein
MLSARQDHIQVPLPPSDYARRSRYTSRSRLAAQKKKRKKDYARLIDRAQFCRASRLPLASSDPLSTQDNNGNTSKPRSNSETCARNYRTCTHSQHLESDAAKVHDGLILKDYPAVKSSRKRLLWLMRFLTTSFAAWNCLRHPTTHKGAWKGAQSA